MSDLLKVAGAAAVFAVLVLVGVAVANTDAAFPYGTGVAVAGILALRNRGRR